MKNRLNILVVIFVLLILFTGSAMISMNKVNKDNRPETFETVLVDVQSYFKKVVKKDVTTPIREVPKQLWTSPQMINVLAYCWLEPGKEYITFNHDLINEVAKGNSDFIFQVILHEYTHCEGRMGHVQMGGHFMNDGGNPLLTRDEVKQQFKDFVKYYNLFYKRFTAREEEDMGQAHAMIIADIDADGNVTTKCTCNACTNLNINN